MSETAQQTTPREAFIVAYYMSGDYGETCSWCERDATVRIDATPGHLIDHACEEHAAEHMHGNGYVLHDTEGVACPRLRPSCAA